jgi:hypothetical protein
MTFQLPCITVISQWREMKNTCKMLCRNSQGKRQLGRFTCRWLNIKLGLREIGCEVKVGFSWNKRESGLL